MSSRAGRSGVDLWSQIIATEEDNQLLQEQQTAIVYRRKKPENPTKENVANTRQLSSGKGDRVSLAPVKRNSWNRSLFTRGRMSIAVGSCVDNGPQRERQKRKPKLPLPKGKGVTPQNYEKERAYFQEVDAFELLEESPSPKNKTWVMGTKNKVMVSDNSSVLRAWLITRKLNTSCRPSASLSRILQTPALSKNSIPDEFLELPSLKTSLETTSETHTGSISIQKECRLSFLDDDALECDTSLTKTTRELLTTTEKDSEDIEAAVRNLSLASQTSLLDEKQRDPLLALLAVCGQPAPSTFSDALSVYCDHNNIAKLGEGTYGEVFLAGETVWKVVPFDGNSLVNGEVQKKAEELLEEVMLSLTLNCLRGDENLDTQNVCPTFMETLNLRVCEGPYDDAMIRAWEQWDKENSSLNDHPKEFAEKQLFVVFVQEHGGEDLEKFLLLNFNEARSLLVQVTVTLAVAEAAFEFEHRDLHWGNILLSRKSSEVLEFILDGKKIYVKTSGLMILIIDFTLSRINTGEDILFLDLSSDPDLFKGPKGDKQSDTYRKMKEVTGDYWEGCFPKTNVLWLHYLVDVLLLDKVFDRTSKDERELRYLKKRLNSYGSAREAVSDPFFSAMLVSHAS